MVRDKVAEAAAEAAAEADGTDTESKTRTPHKDVGKNAMFRANLTFQIASMM